MPHAAKNTMAYATSEKAAAVTSRMIKASRMDNSEYAAYSVAEISAGVIRVISKGQQERRLHDPGDQMHLVIESAKKWQHERWPKR